MLTEILYFILHYTIYFTETIPEGDTRSQYSPIPGKCKSIVMLPLALSLAQGLATFNHNTLQLETQQCYGPPFPLAHLCTLSSP